MVTKTVSIDTAIAMLDGVDAILQGNHPVMVTIARKCEEVARRTLRENKSEGPPLSDKWLEEKENTYSRAGPEIAKILQADMDDLFRPATEFPEDMVAGGATTGPQFSYGTNAAGDLWVEKPYFSIGAEHKGVWTGFLDSRLEGWVVKGMAQVKVGVRSKDTHPIKAVNAVAICWKIEFGGKFGKIDVPPRPFIGAAVTRIGMVEATKESVLDAINGMI